VSSFCALGNSEEYVIGAFHSQFAKSLDSSRVILQDRVLVFLTNHLDLAAAIIASVYKERWQIELFFRALKQSLRVKTFVGTSANALKTQLWTALIAMLLVKYLQLKSTFGWSLSNLVALLRQQLFVYRDLWAWIDNPFQPPPIPDTLPEQLVLQLS
jgi:IS4 transposase